MKHDVVIVGSGNSLMGRNLGNKIDSVDNIIRFGGADVDLHDFAIDTGVKFTTLYHNCNIPAMKRLGKRLIHDSNKYKLLREVVFVYTIFDARRRNCLTTLQRNLNELEISHRLGAIHTECNEKLREHGCGEFIFTPSRRGVGEASSGLYAILDSLERYDEIYLCGFDALCDSYTLETSPRHYYGGVCKIKACHDIQKEADIVRKLMETRGGIHLW